MAVASLVLGICALAFPFIGLGLISVILGIIGIRVLAYRMLLWFSVYMLK